MEYRTSHTVTVRPEKPADIVAIRAVTEAAFDRTDEAEIIDALRASESWIQGLSYIGERRDPLDLGTADASASASAASAADASAAEASAADASAVEVESSSAVIAHALLSRCFIGDRPGVCLAPCSVLPEFQGAGAGTAVIEDLLAEAARRGEEFAVVLGHPDYYPRFGFSRASRFGVSLHVEVPDDALMAMPLAGEVASGALHFAPEFGV